MRERNVLKEEEFGGASKSGPSSMEMGAEGMFKGSTAGGSTLELHDSCAAERADF